MKLIPYDHYKLVTALTEDEVINRIQKKVEPKQFFRFGKQPSTIYEGIVNHEGFRLTRIFAGNSKPLILGELSTENNKTIISITLRLPIGDYIIMSMFFGIWILVGIPIAIFLVSNIVAFFIILLIIPVLYILMIANYLYEHSHTKEVFAKLLEEER